MNYEPLWSPEVEARIRAEAHNIDQQETPTDVKFCNRCVVSNQRPRIVFDDEGVCSACRYAEHKKTIDWELRGRELRTLCNKHRRSSGYDVIVPCSGGKDSSTVAHVLKTEYGMHPLCVKWAPFAYTDIGWQNFQSFVHSGFDVITCFPDGMMHRKLARLAFEYLGDAWQPFAYGQLYYAMHMASKFDIQLVMFGENGEAEYGGDPAADDKPRWNPNDWERVYLKGRAIEDLLQLGLGLDVFSTEEVSRISPFYSLPAALMPPPINRFCLKTLDELNLFETAAPKAAARAYNCLRNQNAHYIGDVVRLTEKELLSEPNFGRRSLAVVKEALARIGLHLGMRLPEWPGALSWTPPVQFHWLSYYRFWHPQGNYYHASEHTGFTANTERSEGTYSKYASIDDRFDGFHFYMAFVKFGIGRCTSDAAHEIRDGEITREEGAALVRRYDGEFPKRYFDEFKEYLGLEDEQFWRVVYRYCKPRIWQCDSSAPDGEWFLRHTVHGWESMVG